MKIVVLDGYTENPGDLSWEGLEKLGELTVHDRTSLTDEEEIIARMGDAEVVLTNKTPISRRVFDACPSVRYVAMLATGYNVVDVAYAKEKGIECYLSLEERMACGIGACLACVCRSKEIDGHSHVHNKRVCKDGPVFRAEEVEL